MNCISRKSNIEKAKFVKAFSQLIEIKNKYERFMTIFTRKQKILRDQSSSFGFRIDENLVLTDMEEEQNDMEMVESMVEFEKGVAKQDSHQQDAHQQDAHQQDAHQQDAHQQDAHQQDAHQQDAHQQDMIDVESALKLVQG
jgi:hypothetical protein